MRAHTHTHTHTHTRTHTHTHTLTTHAHRWAATTLLTPIVSIFELQCLLRCINGMKRGLYTSKQRPAKRVFTAFDNFFELQ